MLLDISTGKGGMKIVLTMQLMSSWFSLHSGRYRAIHIHSDSDWEHLSIVELTRHEKVAKIESEAFNGCVKLKLRRVVMSGVQLSAGK